MAPLIVRSPMLRPLAVPIEAPKSFGRTDAAAWLDDLRLFATGWVGGLVFFGTLFS